MERLPSKEESGSQIPPGLTNEMIYEWLKKNRPGATQESDLVPEEIHIPPQEPEMPTDEKKPGTTIITPDDNVVENGTINYTV
jgi:hypothetical protein